MNGMKMLRPILLAGLVLPGTAFAQSAAADNRPNDIIVTATKREQTLLDVPLSVAVVGGDKMESMGITKFDDFQSSVPNLQIDQSNGNFIVSMRGLGSGGGNLAFEQSVGVFNDGVYSGRSRSLQTALMDVARVEIVRGPQGALFGKNTNAGAISIVSRAPTREFEAQLRGRYEFENKGYGGSGFLSGPLNENFSARLSFQAGHEGGTVYNRYTKRDDFYNNNYGVRGQLLFEPVGGGGSMLLKVEYAQNNYEGGNLVYNGLGTCPGICTNIRNSALPFGGMPDRPSFERVQNSIYPEFSRTGNLNVTLTSKLDLGGGFELSSVTGYQQIRARTQNDVDASPVQWMDSWHKEDTSQLSQEARISGSLGPVDVIFGGNYFYAKTNIYQKIFVNGVTALGPPIGPLMQGIIHLPFRQTSESLSPFVAVDWKLIDGLTFSGSLRYNHEVKRALIQGIMEGVLLYRPYSFNPKRTESLWDYSARLSYKFDQNVQVYASYATGSKGGGFVSNNSQLGATQKYQFEPERARSWEAGVKARLLENRLDVNLAAFTTTFTNLQVSSYTGSGFTTGNAAKAKSQGIEADVVARPVDILTLGGSIAYLDAHYIDYPGGPCIYNSTGCNPAIGMNLAGLRLTRAPEWKWNVYGEVRQPIATDWTLSARASASYTGLTVYQDDRYPNNMMPAHTTIDGRIAVSSEPNGFDVALVGRNLTNKVVFSQSFGTPLVPQTWAVFVNPGRTIALEVSKRF